MDDVGTCLRYNNILVSDKLEAWLCVKVVT